MKLYDEGFERGVRAGMARARAEMLPHPTDGHPRVETAGFFYEADCTYLGGNEDPSKCNSSRCPRHGTAEPTVNERLAAAAGPIDTQTGKRTTPLPHPSEAIPRAKLEEADESFRQGWFEGVRDALEVAQQQVEYWSRAPARPATHGIFLQEAQFIANHIRGLLVGKPKADDFEYCEKCSSRFIEWLDGDESARMDRPTSPTKEGA